MKAETNYVYEVYLQQSFSKAAQKLFISQPALSIAIKKVEDELGMSLFDRTRQPIRLTAAGEIYISNIKRIQNIEEDLRSQLNDLSELKCGKIHIGGTQYFNSYVLPPVLAKFKRDYPGVEIELTEAASVEISKKLYDNTIDLMFHCGDTDKQKFSYQKIFQDHILLAVPKYYEINKQLTDYALDEKMVQKGYYLTEKCKPVSLTYFCDCPFLILTPGNNLHQRTLSLCRDAGFEPNICLVLEQLVTAYRLCCYGLGVSFVSALLVRNSISPDTLYYKIDSELSTRHFSAVLRKSDYVPQTVKAFLHTVNEIYKDTLNCPTE